MPRYLAPARIGLLALVELYAEGAVPNDAIIPVIDFITTHLLDCSLINPSAGLAERWKKADSTIKLIASVHHFEELLGGYPAADRLPGRRLWDRFLEKLWGIDSLHSLHEFFDQLPNLLQRTKAELRELAARGEEPPSGVLFSRNSPFGVFLRRSYLEFSRMQFSQAAELWKVFVKYRQPTAAYWRRRNPHYSRLSFDSVLLAGEHEWGDQTDEIAVAAYGNMLLMDDEDATVPVSTDEIESLLEFQIEQVQKYGVRVPTEIREQFQTLLKSSRTVPSLSHYLSFSDSWRAGDLPASFDYLHRYFDYTMQSRDRLFYQYALLNLGIVQSDFGCHREAVATMLEAITTAKENRDTTCLNFALNWFFHFGRAHPNLVRELQDSSMLGTGKESLVFLRAKAKETGMWILWSSALLSEAKLGLANGESVSVAMESMVRSSQLIVEKNVKTMIGPQLSLVIALWDRLGLGVLSTMVCDVFLRCHGRSAVLDDRLKLTCRMAGLLAAKGKYADAFAKLDTIDPSMLRSAKPDQYWHLYRGILKLRRDLHHNNLESAENLLYQLLQSGPEDIDPDLVFIIDSLHIEALTRRQDFNAAFTKIEKLMSQLREESRDVSLRIRLLLAKVHLFDCIGRPEKGFTLAMRAAGMAWRARLVALLWQAIGAVANILNALGEFAAAEQLLVAVLPRSLETDATYTNGVLYSLLADARIGLAGEMQGRGGATERAEMLAKALKALDAGYQCFSAVEDVNKRCEMMAKKATVLRAEGDHVRAAECIDTYLRLWEEEMARR
ncbi:b5091e30-43dc-4bbc-a460-388954bb0b71 [Thermothielavioides terrestris]|uniref:Anaphase-promoting complex subunit 5 n=1 Tax=Thermothielavioides terrestris TaxID=2587410 RepID=A0A3S4AKI1_9PEZI|nr:b5091e30-43dc-4bbc-a460-388954bb0b71 [Thermothielavioides terrestris]